MPACSGSSGRRRASTFRRPGFSGCARRRNGPTPPPYRIPGLHKTQDRPIAIAGKVEIRPMMYVALSYDHRVIDGQQAVLVLARVKELMEDPAAMLLA